LRVPEGENSYAIVWCNDFGKRRIESGIVTIAKKCSIQESQYYVGDNNGEVSPASELQLGLTEEVVSTPNTTIPKAPNEVRAKSADRMDSQQSSTIRIESAKFTNWNIVFSISLLSAGLSLVNHNAINAEILNLLSEVSEAVEGKAPWRVQTQQVRTMVLCDTFQKWRINSGTITISYKCPATENL
jgi:hypothetical protein